MLGKLVKLRAFEPAEADALWRWNHDPDVMRWMDDGYAASLARVRQRLGSAPRTRTTTCCTRSRCWPTAR